MGNLLVSLRNAAGAMRVFERGMAVVQGNVTNVSTPGYAKQRQILQSMRFDLEVGLPGGVASGGTLDSRSEFAEAGVRRSLGFLGEAEERAQHLQGLEPVFALDENSGLSRAMNRMFQAFSALAVAPNDSAGRRVALDRAGDLARSFRAVSQGVAEGLRSAERGVVEQVERINGLVGQVVEVNRQFQSDFRAQGDAGLQARMNDLLEQLSEVADFTVLRQEDGTATLYLGGQTLLAIGARQYELKADTSGQQAMVLDAGGLDVAGQVSRGRLHAVVGLRNEVIPAHQAELDGLAAALADRVNTLLGGGVDMSGQPPVQALFRYDAALGAARTLEVNDLAPAELALASPASPGGNAVALELAGLSQEKTAGGVTFSEYFGNIAAALGRQVAGAQETAGTHRQLAAQARQLREDAQKVNLDEEAIALIEFQRSYQASARLVQTLNEMTDTVLNMLR
ncbi:MAG: flagellar hook-associated protein FlgK [Candidatus Solibacter usitatus]|nr:flagellar hook-associated protein FlgK [Candidatus Solibacter usitatus]